MNIGGQVTDALRADGLVNAAEVARAVGMNRSTLHRWCALGKVPAEKIGTGWYIRVHRWTAMHPFPEGTEPAKRLRALSQDVLRANMRRKGTR